MIFCSNSVFMFQNRGLFAWFFFLSFEFFFSSLFVNCLMGVYSFISFCFFRYWLDALRPSFPLLLIGGSIRNLPWKHILHLIQNMTGNSVRG